MNVRRLKTEAPQERRSPVSGSYRLFGNAKIKFCRSTFDNVEGAEAKATENLLDSVLCAVQAAWAYTQRKDNYGVPETADPRLDL